MDIFESVQLGAALSEVSVSDLQVFERRARWRRHLARPAQLPPPDQEWDIWLLLAGRGFGKTRTATEWLWWEAWNDPGSFNHVVVRRSEDLEKVAFEGPSGLFKVTPPEIVAQATRSPYRMVLKNGAKILGYSAEEPDVLRGPEAHRTWCDELAAWKRLDAAWNDGVLFGTRLKSRRNNGRPKIVVTTTPRPIKMLAELEKESKNPESGVIVTRGSTKDNIANLAPRAVERLMRKFQGTRRGKQELDGLIMMDIPGALFTLDNIAAHRRWDGVPELRQIVVAIDPPAKSVEGSNECGIIAAAKGADGRGYLLRDESDVMSPDEWGRTAVQLLDELQGDHIVVETNQGGEMCRTVIEAAAERLWREKARKSRFVVVKEVHASRGKVIRAEPVSQLYAQGFISHVGEFEELEGQMTVFTPDFDRNKEGSPDRLDAMVWAFTDLLVDADPDFSDALLHAAPRGVGWKIGAHP